MKSFGVSLHISMHFSAMCWKRSHSFQFTLKDSPICHCEVSFIAAYPCISYLNLSTKILSDVQTDESQKKAGALMLSWGYLNLLGLKLQKKNMNNSNWIYSFNFLRFLDVHNLKKALVFVTRWKTTSLKQNTHTKQTKEIN